MILTNFGNDAQVTIHPSRKCVRVKDKCGQKAYFPRILADGEWKVLEVEFSTATKAIEAADDYVE